MPPFLSRFTSSKHKKKASISLPIASTFTSLSSSSRPDGSPTTPAPAPTTAPTLNSWALPSPSLSTFSLGASPLPSTLVSDIERSASTSYSSFGGGGGSGRTTLFPLSPDRRSETSVWIAVDESASDENGLCGVYGRDDEGLETKINVKKREERAKADKVKMDRARLGPESACELVRLCGEVIRQQGATTLGLFRPYRTAETPSSIRRLALLFLSYSAEVELLAKSAGQDDVFLDLPKELFGERRRSSPKRDLFAKELQSGNVHDVVAVLKWGLRHLVYPTTESFSGSTRPPLHFYSYFLSTPLSSRSFHALLSTLPPVSQKLLREVLPVLSSLAANSESSGLNPHTLCHSLGLYLFGLGRRDGPWPDWRELESDWRRSGEVLFEVLRVYLASQEGLPARLRDVREGNVARTRLVECLVVEFKSEGEWVLVPGVNEQETGKAGRRGVKRRKPLEVLQVALGLEGGAEVEEWKKVVRGLEWKQGGAVDLLSSETRRVLGILELDGPVEREEGKPNGAPFSLLPPPTKRSKEGSEVPPLSTPTWNEFEKRGFAGTSPALESVNEFGLFAPTTAAAAAAPAPTTSRRGSSGGLFRNRSLRNSISRTLSRPTSQEMSQAPTRELGLGAGSGPGAGGVGGLSSRPTSVILRKPVHRLVDVAHTEINADFCDAWLDSLSDPGVCSAWPSLVVTELDPELVQTGSAKYLLISQVLVPFSGTEAESPTTTATKVDGPGSLKWKMPSLFGRTSSYTGSVAGQSGPDATTPYLDIPTSTSPLLPSQPHTAVAPDVEGELTPTLATSASFEAIIPPPGLESPTASIASLPGPKYSLMRRSSSAGSTRSTCSIPSSLRTSLKHKLSVDSFRHRHAQPSMESLQCQPDDMERLSNHNDSTQQLTLPSHLAAPERPATPRGQDRAESIRTVGSHRKAASVSSLSIRSVKRKPVPSLLDFEPPNSPLLGDDEVSSLKAPSVLSNGESRLVEFNTSSTPPRPSVAPSSPKEAAPSADIATDTTAEVTTLLSDSDATPFPPDAAAQLPPSALLSGSMDVYQRDAPNLVTASASIQTSPSTVSLDTLGRTPETKEAAPSLTDTFADGPTESTLEDIEPEAPSTSVELSPAFRTPSPIATRTAIISQPDSISPSPARNSPVTSLGSPSIPSPSRHQRTYSGANSLGGLVRRNVANPSATPKLGGGEAETDLQREERHELHLREVHRREGEERKRKVPAPVSSVKKRVQEIEEEAAGLTESNPAGGTGGGGATESTPTKFILPALPLSPTHTGGSFSSRYGASPMTTSIPSPKPPSVRSEAN